MRRIKLRMNEQRKYQVIKDLVDQHKNKRRAALTLDITVRQVNRLIRKYQDKGKAAFVHGNRNRQPVNCLTTEINKQIVTLYRSKYQDCNFKHYTELLNRREHLPVSYSSVYSRLTQADIYPPKLWRKTRKKRAKARYRAKHPTAKTKTVKQAVNYQLALEDAHPRRERCKYFGEEIQMDASSIVWFGTKKAALHLAIDDATGNLVGAYFDWQETLNGYYHVFEQILKNYGIPYRFKTDNRTVFNYETAKTKSEHKDVLTQFGYACQILGVNLVTTSVSQAKGRIERANQTVQSRLKPELRLAGVTTIEQANHYLTATFIPAFNREFGQDYRQVTSTFEQAPDNRKINYTLAVLSPRVFDSGSTISFKHKYYQAVKASGELVCFMKGTKCLVIEALDGQLLVTVKDQVYALKELAKNAQHSPDLDVAAKPKRPKKKYLPPMSHPWKRASFLAQQRKAHYQHQYA